MYDPFKSGSSTFVTRTLRATDAERTRSFDVDVWAPEERLPGGHPLVIYSHSSGAKGRRSATFLYSHLASHGYVVAAMDHSEIVAPELARIEGEAAERRRARIQGVIENRVPDIRFLLDQLLEGPLKSEVRADPLRIGIVGHSFGGWTALAATEADQRIGAVVAHAPAGSSNPRPGILPVTLSFDWGREVPALFLAAENDVSIPLEGIYELVERAPQPKLLIILRRSDHLHFADDVEAQHEAIRMMEWPTELAWIAQEMLPIAELSSGEQAHAFTRGLTLAHLDATLRGNREARRFLDGRAVSELAARGIDAIIKR